MDKKIRDWYSAVLTSMTLFIIVSKIKEKGEVDEITFTIFGLSLIFFVYLFYKSAITPDLPKRKEIILDRKNAIKKADKWFSKYIRAKYPICVICKKPTTDCGHFIRREILATRWLEINAVGMCRECNLKNEINPEPLNNFFKTYHDDKIVIKLNKLKYNNSIKFYTKDIIDVAMYYKEKYKYIGEEIEIKKPEILEKIEKIVEINKK